MNEKIRLPEVAIERNDSRGRRFMVRVPYRVDDGTIIIDTDYAFGAVECMRNEADELFGGPINTIAEFNRNKRKRRA